jgi:hypothetical protein
MGGFGVVAGGKPYYFDFCTSYGTIRELDPSIIDFELRDEDFSIWDGAEEVVNHLHEITKLEETYAYATSGGSEFTDLKPVSILYLKFTDCGEGKREEFPVSNSNVKCTCYETDHDWQIDYELSDDILNECVRRSETYSDNMSSLFGSVGTSFDSIGTSVTDKDVKEALVSYKNGDTSKLDYIIKTYYDYAMNKLVARCRKAVEENNEMINQICNKDGSSSAFKEIWEQMQSPLKLDRMIKRYDAAVEMKDCRVADPEFEAKTFDEIAKEIDKKEE